MIGDAVFARITDLKYTETIGKTCLPNLCFFSLFLDAMSFLVFSSACASGEGGREEGERGKEGGKGTGDRVACHLSPRIKSAPPPARGLARHNKRFTIEEIIKIVATRCQIIRLKCIKSFVGWGSAPDPAGRAYSAPPDLLAGF